MSNAPKEGIRTNGSTMPYQRRRRKRNRIQQTARAGERDESTNEVRAGCGDSAKALRLTQDFYKEDCSQFAFLDKNGDGLVDGRPQFRSLPILLEERKNGIWRTKQKKWQSKMLFNFTKKPAETYIGRRQWRPFANRKIPFTRLGSPTTDAVLAIEQNGDYVLTLGTMTNDDFTGLALRFYGINSPASRTRRNHSHWNSDTGNNTGNVLRAPLLQTTPLHYATRRPSSDFFADVEELFDTPSDFSPSTTSMELIVSKDWKVGVALLHPTKTDGALQMDSQQENNNNPYNDLNASMVFFTLPRRHHSSGRTINTENGTYENVIFEFGKVPMACNESRRKMLWSVESIPNKNETNPNSTGIIYDTYFRAPGYLLLNYEGDGVRINWATEKCFLVHSCLCEVSVDSRFASGTRSSASAEILSHSQNSSWREIHCNKMEGTVIDGNLDADNQALSAQVTIVNESFLHLDVLLAEVLSRRKGISETRPDFCYSLISINRGGRIADFVIVFTRRKKACSLGFYVKIDLFTGMFVELDWVQSKQKTDIFSLQNWCNKLALNRRMKDLRAGPFAVTEKHALDCTRLCREIFTFDNDEDDDYDESYWKEFVVEAEGKKKRCQAPKLVTLSSLYPCCDLITNQAIINFEPVMMIRAKDSPIQLVYT